MRFLIGRYTLLELREVDDGRRLAHTRARYFHGSTTTEAAPLVAVFDEWAPRNPTVFASALIMHLPVSELRAFNARGGSSGDSSCP
jgi:hypothetical protein